MCSSSTDQVRSIAKVTTAVVKCDLTQKKAIKVDVKDHCQLYGGPIVFVYQ